MQGLSDHDFMFIERFLLSFKELGGTADGLIDYNAFQTYLSQEGDSMAEILHVLDGEECVNDNYLNYFQLCASLLASKVAFNSVSLENGRIGDASIPINTRTFTRKKTSSRNNSIHKDSDPMVFKHQIRGSLFYMDDNLVGNRYHMELLEDSCIEIDIKLVEQRNFTENTPIEILILQDKDKILTSSFFNRSEDNCTIRYNFKKGKYVLVPVNFIWPKKGRGTVNLASLIDMDDDGQVVLTESCERALKMVFDTVDLDQNGLLSQLEFDLFIQHTSGETAANEWSTIEDNFHTEDQQLTFDGFIELYKLVLQTDPADVTQMLELMGVNEALEQQNAQPFTLVIQSETSQFLLSPLPVTSYRLTAEKGLCKMAIEQGSSKKVKNMNDLFVYTLSLPHQMAVVIQNQSHSKVTVRLDCSDSVNCQSHRNSLDCTIQVMPKSSTLGHYLVPLNPYATCIFECVDELK